MSKRRVLPTTFLLTVSILLCSESHEAIALDLPDPPEETGYFDGRFWQAGFSRGGSVLVLDDRGRLIVAGSNLGTDLETNPFLARWDGRVWETLATNMGIRWVEAMVAVETNLFVAGGLGRTQGLSIARVDGQKWHWLGDGIGTRPLSVFSLAAYGGSLYAGGLFTNAGSLSVTNIARWDIATETWNALGSGLAEPVRAIAAGPDGVAAGSGSRVAHWTGSAWELLGQFGPNGSAEILALRWQDGDLYAAGTFGSVNGLNVTAVVRWRSGQWEPVGPFPLQGTGTGLGTANGRLFVSGALRVPDPRLPQSADVVSLTDEGWTIEIPGSSSPGPSRSIAHSMVTENNELFVLASNPLEADARVGTPAVWHYDGTRWGVINGGLGGQTGTSLALHEGGAVVTFFRGTINSLPLWHDGARFVNTRSATNKLGDRIRLGPTVATIGSTAVAAGWWASQPTSLLVTHLVGDTWQPLTTPVPLNSILRFASGSGSLYVAGRTSLPEGAVWSWNGAQWSPIGGTFARSSIPSFAPPTGTEPSRLYSLEWHQGRLLAGCATSLVNGQVRSNLVVWNGTTWEQFLELSGPATVLRSADGILYVSWYGPNQRPVLKAWNGTTFDDLSRGLGLATLGGVDVSASGLLAAVGTPGGQSPPVPLWFRREGRWVQPRDWTSRFLPGGFVNCRWMGQDLYLTGSRIEVSGMESLGLAIWHEPGPWVMVNSNPPGLPRLQATGAIPARFVWEQSDRLTDWAPFATNALGNPGAITAPGPETDARFYRIRPLP